MGGVGSGRYDYATTPTVAECYQLVSDRFTEVVHGPHEGHADLSWGDSVSIRVFVENPSGRDLAEGIRLRYVSDPGGKDVSHDYVVRFSYTEPNYGGVRPWFLCPSCETQRGKLYLPPAGLKFACRECHELGYQSSRQSGQPVFRAIHRYRNAFQKADAEGRRPHPNGTPHFPARPSGMHTETFQRRLQDVKDARSAFHEAMDKKTRSMLRKYRESDEF